MYDDIAHHFCNTRIYQWNWVKNYLENIEKKSIVYDIGCGNGRNMQCQGIHFLGVDNCKDFLSICRSKNLNVLEADMTDIPLRDNSADAIICIAAFHHLKTEEERVKTMLEFKRLVAPGGSILLSVWSKIQPEKTRRTFEHYGDTLVPWNKYGKVYQRYYYIFKIEELKKIISDCHLIISDHFYDCGNEVFLLSCP